jgi:hypothetical protein
VTHQNALLQLVEPPAIIHLLGHIQLQNATTLLDTNLNILVSLVSSTRDASIIALTEQFQRMSQAAPIPRLPFTRPNLMPVFRSGVDDPNFNALLFLKSSDSVFQRNGTTYCSTATLNRQSWMASYSTPERRSRKASRTHDPFRAAPGTIHPFTQTNAMQEDKLKASFQWTENVATNSVHPHYHGAPLLFTDSQHKNRAVCSTHKPTKGLPGPIHSSTTPNLQVLNTNSTTPYNTHGPANEFPRPLHNSTTNLQALNTNNTVRRKEFPRSPGAQNYPQAGAKGFRVPERTERRTLASNEPRQLHNREDFRPDLRGMKHKSTRDNTRSVEDRYQELLKASSSGSKHYDYNGRWISGA